VSSECIFVDPQKVEAVLRWEKPTTVTEIRSLKGKLALRFIGPFEILKRVRPVAYEINLPS